MIEKSPKTALFKQILHCTNLHSSQQGCESHPCRKVIAYQKNKDENQWQLPEPWNGNLHAAPVLVVSSNPSIYEEDYAPRKDFSLESAFDFYNNRFAGSHPKSGLPYVLNDTRVLKVSGNYGRPVRFFNCIKRRVQEVYNFISSQLHIPSKLVKPGLDYCIVDIVRCKSQGEKGVVDAMETCYKLHMPETLKQSPARCILVFGRKAHIQFAKEVLHLDDVPSGSAFTVEIQGLERTVCFVGHPSSSLPQKFEHVIQNNYSLLDQFVNKHKNDLVKWFA